MNKIKCIVLLLGIILSATINLANSRLTNDGVSPVVINKISNTGSDRSSSISVSINGHDLTVSFLENLGNVNIEIENVAGIVIEYNCVETPSGYLYYIPLAGRYTITFTLSNGDKYYGEFEVTE